ncbi:unnamed protein product, partial [Meganyctiphanes norvegica]
QKSKHFTGVFHIPLDQARDETVHKFVQSALVVHSHVHQAQNSYHTSSYGGHRYHGSGYQIPVVCANGCNCSVSSTLQSQHSLICTNQRFNLKLCNSKTNCWTKSYRISAW